MRMPAVILAVALLLPACVAPAPISRNELTARMPPLIRLERRFDRIKAVVALMRKREMLSNSQAVELVQIYDVYWFYYSGATSALARAEINLYYEMIKLARHELETIEEKLKIFTVPMRHHSPRSENLATKKEAQ